MSDEWTYKPCGAHAPVKGIKGCLLQKDHASERHVWWSRTDASITYFGAEGGGVKALAHVDLKPGEKATDQEAYLIFYMILERRKRRSS